MIETVNSPPATAYLAQRHRCVRALLKVSCGAGWSGTDRHWHACQVDRFFNNLAAYEKRMAAPNQRKTRRLRDSLLTSYSGRLCGFLQDAYVRGLAKVKPMSPEQLEAILRSSRPDRPIFEPAVVKSQSKANGDKRIMVSPGRKVRAAQRLVSDVLDASRHSNPFDYNQTRKGTNAAVAEVVRLVEEEGIRDFVVFDLENYFTSVDAKHLQGVPLPSKVIQHSVFFNRNAILLHTNLNAAEAEAARHGLPQGARVSGNLASSLLGRELRQLDGAMGIVTYVDDGVIGACDPAGAKSLAKAIEMRLGTHPGGPLSFKKLAVQSIEHGFPFLGYWLSLDQSSEVPKVRVRPSNEAWLKFQKKLARKLSSYASKPNWDQAAEVGLTYLGHWKAGFPLWQPEETEIFEAEGRVETMVSDWLSGIVGKPGVPVLPSI